MKVLFLMVLFVVTIQMVYNILPGVAVALAAIGTIYALNDTFN